MQRTAAWHNPERWQPWRSKCAGDCARDCATQARQAVCSSLREVGQGKRFFADRHVEDNILVLDRGQLIRLINYFHNYACGNEPSAHGLVPGKGQLSHELAVF